ncbi:hypothetical protein [Aeromonas media]|uniref:hypothetical protein n=1 Tax=Aeromonas media TaxID=651 RepID=UPI002954AF56|nr:hypothetical protein [Aeromonas media]WOQ15172.1 hypothetical protein R2X36_10145 [Aeromonas media]
MAFTTKVLKFNKKAFEDMKREFTPDDYLCHSVNRYWNGYQTAGIEIQRFTLGCMVIDYVEQQIAAGKALEEIDVVVSDIRYWDSGRNGEDVSEGLYHAVKYAHYIADIDFIDEMSTEDCVVHTVHTQIDNFIWMAE